MTEARKRVTAKEKAETMATEKCYVCTDLKLNHAGFEGYAGNEVAYDHFQAPFSAVGSPSAEVLPIHNASGGSTPDDEDYETSKRRNCHSLRKNDFNSRAGYVQVLRARMQSRTVRYIDDVGSNPARDGAKKEFKLPVTWGSTEADFYGKKYDIVTEVRDSLTWRRFLTTLPASKMFTDDISQVRPGTHKTLAKMVHTYIADQFPTFAPVNARIDPCGHVVLFDGNHRGTSDALSFGVDALIPVMVWEVQPGTACAIRGAATEEEKEQAAAPSAAAPAVSAAGTAIPSLKQLYELLVRLHDDVRQTQYPYSAKVLKWGIIKQSEIDEAILADPSASETTVWLGSKPADVAQMLAGGLTRYLDQDGIREKWMENGFAEGSWKTFLEQYAMLKASSASFNSPTYLRQDEMDNLAALARILDEEIFSIPAMKGPTNLRASFKSKWWKECHKIFAEAAQTAVYYKMGLSERPKQGLCHTELWTPEVLKEIRAIAKRWATCKVWDKPQGTARGGRLHQQQREDGQRVPQGQRVHRPLPRGRLQSLAIPPHPTG